MNPDPLTAPDGLPTPLRGEARRVLEVEAEAIRDLVGRLDGRFDRAIELLAECRGRVVTTGMGKSGIIARKLAATFSSTGTPALFMHPAEAVHGDLGSVVEGDVLVALSQSGETGEIARLLETIKRLGIALIALTGKSESTLAGYADTVLDVGVKSEACPLGLAPTASTTAALAMGDALAMALLRRKGFKVEDFAAVHPGGQLGRNIRRVSDLMHSGTTAPRVATTASFSEVIAQMTGGGIGMTVVVNDEGTLAGILTDGDLRRILQSRLGNDGQALEALKAAEVMTSTPRTIDPEALASEALRHMEDNQITSLVVVDSGNRPLGVIHLHDLWRTELI